MYIKQMGLPRRQSQAGFTLIELIVVIVVLGILAATALPRFANVGGDARLAKLNAARGAVSSAVAMTHGKWLAAGSPSTAQTIDGVSMNTTGYPTGDANGIGVAAGLGAGTAGGDYLFGTVASGALPIYTDSSHSSCSFNYTEATGTVGAAPTASNCN